MSEASPRTVALREAVRIAPQDVGLRRMLAESLVADGNAAEAVTSFRECLAMEPNHGPTLLALARAYDAAGNPAAALVVVDDHLSRVGEGAEVLLLGARLLERLGRLDDARDAYRAAVEADPRVADLDFAARLGAAGVGETAGGRGAVVDPLRDSAAATAGGGTAQSRDDDRAVPWPTSGTDDGGSRFEEQDPSGLGFERPRITFGDVGGMDAVKDEVRIKIIHPLEHGDLYRAYGKTAGGGILLYGPPGCGKTHLARATAGEVRASFLAVGINDILDMWIGSSERNLHAIFDGARTHRPAVLFFDEVDALAADRADFRGSTGRHVVNQFLAELDGIESSNEGVLVLAATNAPWHLDAAFRRPGRFDRVIFVPPPDLAARRAILAIHLRDRPVKDVDLDALGRRTDGFSGADLKGLVDLAVEAKLRQAVRDGIPMPLTTKDLLDAAKRMSPSTKDWFATARNYVLYANQAGLYDPVRPYLKL